MFETATLQEKKVLLRRKKRLLKEKQSLEYGKELLGVAINKLEAEGYFEKGEAK